MYSEDSNSIVISGVSGRYPECDNIEEFWTSLINGKPLYTSDSSRWPQGKFFFSFFKSSNKFVIL